MKTVIFAAITALCFLLAAALGRWPYAFYILLRLFVSVTAVYVAYTSAQSGRTAWAWIMGSYCTCVQPDSAVADASCRLASRKCSDLRTVCDFFWL